MMRNRGKMILSFLLITGLLISILPVNALRVMAAGSETELILNGDFSEKVDPDTNPGPVPKWKGDGCTLSLGDDQGNPYMIIGSRGNGFSSAQQSVKGNFKKGDKISYSYKLKAPKDPRRHSRFVVKYEGTYTDIPEEPFFSKAPATAEWTVVSGSLTLTRDASTLMFQIDDGSNSNGTESAFQGTGADLHIDDVSVKLEREMAEVPVTGVKVSQTTLNLLIGNTSTLTATVQPAEAVQTVTWSSSDSKIASVEQYTGLVTAVASGTATITATSTVDRTKKANCTVTVPEVPVSGITLNQTTLSLVAGEAARRLTATIQPANAANKNVTWSTSDPSVATVNNGMVTPVAAGSAIITVTSVADDTKMAQCTVTVIPATIAVTGVSLNKTEIWMTEGKTETLAASVAPEDATDKDLIWDSSDESVATVNDGVVTAVAPGIATVTVTSAADGSKQAECTVMVSRETVLVTGVKMDKSTLSLAIGEAGTIAAAVEPANAWNTDLIWITSNASVASAINGRVTAVGGGTAKITAISVADNTKRAECTVTVTVPVPKTIVKVGDKIQSGSLTYIVSAVNTAKKSGTMQVAAAPGNKKLKTIVIKDTISYLGITFKVESIAANAFKNNNAASSVKIGKYVKEIKNGAFSGCKKLKKVTTGAALTKIGKQVFFNDKQLKTVDLRKSKKLKTVGSRTFKGIYKKAVIRVPSAKYKAYKKLLNGKGLSKSTKIKK